MSRKISIIVSVYNEEKVLEKFFQAFDRIVPSFVWDYEIIFVNDGSVDGSLSLLKDYAKSNKKAKIINFSRNFGHEAAMQAGIDYARGDGLICMDADLQHPLDCIPQIVNKIEAGYDVVSMIRRRNRSAGIIKNISSKVFYKTINLLSNQSRFEESASDFFGISRTVAEILKKNYRERVRFLRGYTQNIGFNKTTLEYVAEDRVGGKSHYNLKNLTKLSIDTIVSFSDFPLKLGLYLSILSAAAGLLIALFSKGSGATYDNRFLTIFTCFMFSLLFLTIGIIGKYLSVLLLEVKSRPIYLIQETINFHDEDNSICETNLS